MNKMNQNSENVKNPKLVAALQEMLKHDDFITRSQMAAALMEARLLSPIQKQTVLTEKKVRLPGFVLRALPIPQARNIILPLPIWTSTPNGTRMEAMTRH